jgi:hypothetical protein
VGLTRLARPEAKAGPKGKLAGAGNKIKQKGAAGPASDYGLN